MNVEPIPENKTEKIERINIDFLMLRKCLGVLGLLLPFALVISNGFKVEESISHYYYTDASVVFTGVLIAFGLFLISYKGYPKKDGEGFSDNAITNVAGFCAIIVALVPTACALCNTGVPNWHDNTIASSIHLVSAGIFIVSMGYMSFNQFVKGEDDSLTARRRKRVYRISGIVLWTVIAILLVEVITKRHFTDYDVFIGETIALLFFGTAWLIKGEFLEKMGL